MHLLLQFYHLSIYCCCCCIASVVSNSVRPHRRQPTRLPRSWDSPGRNTGVGCHFLLQCMKVKSESEVAQSCPTDSSDPMVCSLPASSVHGIFWAKVLEWGAIAFSKVYTIQFILYYHVYIETSIYDTEGYEAVNGICHSSDTSALLLHWISG